MAHEELIQEVITEIAELEQEKVALEQVIQEMKVLITEMQNKDAQDSAIFRQRYETLLKKVTAAEE